MHDPADSKSAPPRSPESPAPSGEAGYECVLELVQRVIAGYTRQILAEQRAAVPDVDRLARLMAERQACVGQRRGLDDADPGQLAAVAAAYDARLKNLVYP